MAYKVIILYQLYMPSYFLGTFTEYPYGKDFLSALYCSLSGYLFVLELGYTETFALDIGMAFYYFDCSVLCDDGLCLSEIV